MPDYYDNVPVLRDWFRSCFFRVDRVIDTLFRFRYFDVSML